MQDVASDGISRRQVQHRRTLASIRRRPGDSSASSLIIGTQTKINNSLGGANEYDCELIWLQRRLVAPPPPPRLRWLGRRRETLDEEAEARLHCTAGKV